MTHPTEPLPPMPSTPPPSGSRGSRKPFLTGLALGAVVAAVVTSGVFVALDDSGSGKRPAAADSKPGKKAGRTDVEDTTAEETPEEVYNPYPTPDDFTLKLKTTSKHCFGSGVGCNVTVEPDGDETSYNSPLPLDPSATVYVTYEIRGDENGPITETMEVRNGGTMKYTPTPLSTASNGVKVTAKVTGVRVAP